LREEEKVKTSKGEQHGDVGMDSSSGGDDEGEDEEEEEEEESEPGGEFKSSSKKRSASEKVRTMTRTPLRIIGSVGESSLY